MSREVAASSASGPGILCPGGLETSKMSTEKLSSRTGEHSEPVAAAPESDFTEREWLRAQSRNPAFDVLADSAEDIYSLSDGLPFLEE